MDKLISVIVPVYNVENWLPRCLDSIINQTYKNLEIIVINDGSKDNSASIINEYANKDRRIVAVHQENQGLIAVREKGIEIASGDYVGFVDGDDAINEYMYEKLINNAIKYNADISHCGLMFCFENGNVVEHYGSKKLVIQDNFNGIKDLLEGKFVEPSLCNKLYAKHLLGDSCLDKNVLNNEDLLRNYILFKRSHKSVYEDFCGYHYIQHEGSMSKDQTKSIMISKHVIKARKLILDNASNEIKPYAMQLFLNAIVNSINQMTFSKEKEVIEYCECCREMLIKEKKNICYLIKRQQIAAWLIVISPSLHRIIYSLYKR